MFDTLDTTVQNPRKAWSAAVSFTVQTFGVGVLLLIPLIYTDALPLLRNDKFRLPPPPQGRTETVTKIISTEVERPTVDPIETRFTAPQRIPETIERYVDRKYGLAPDPSFAVIGVTGGTGEVSNPLLNPLIAVAEPPRPAPPSVAPKTIRVSVLELGALVRRVEPVYPTSARIARVQGPVKLHAVIDTAGRITSLQVLSGHPLLVAAAMDAVRQWRYRPYVLNGEPVPVETDVTVNFSLN